MKGWIVLAFILTLFFGGLFLAMQYDERVTETNWWTDVFCDREDGLYYDMMRSYDSCYIDQIEYRAYFGIEEICSNLTSLGCSGIWSLEEVRLAEGVRLK